MEHPFEYRAHFNAAGQVCHCPWGPRDPEHLGSIKEASKLKWLEDRPDMQQERNQFWLNYIKEGGFANEQTDKLLPWLHREFKKGRILPGKTPFNPTRHMKFKEDGSQWAPEEVVHRAIQWPEEPEVGVDYTPEGQPLGKGAPWAAVQHSDHSQNITPPVVAEWQAMLEEMSKKRQGVDVMQHKVHELWPKLEDFRKWKEAQQRQHLGEVVHKFNDGWTIRQLQNIDEMGDEGERMGHCIGAPEHGCPQRHEEGRSVFASLRDPHNFPHATIELEPHSTEEAPSNSGWQDDGHQFVPRIGPNSRSTQFYGKEDSAPLPEYEKRIDEWLKTHGAPSAEPGGAGPDEEEEEEEPREAAWATTYPPQSIEAYNSLHGEGNYWDHLDEIEEGLDPGESTEWELGDPDWSRIADNFLEGNPAPRPGEEPPEVGHRQEKMEVNEPTPLTRYGPNVYTRQNFYQYLMENDSHRGDFDEELEWQVDPMDPYHNRLMGEYEQAKEKYKNPHGGMGWRPYLPADDPNVNPLFTPNPNAGPVQRADGEQFVRNEDGTVVTRPNQYGQNVFVRPTVYGPEQSPYTYATKRKPLYYRWIFSPQKGVTLGTNSDDHPALVKYHQALGGDINDTDLTHGYASPIGNGWRVTDLDHQPVEDPFIVNQVVRRLNHEDGPQMPSHEGLWRPIEYDWDRLHYGLPREKVGSF